MNRYLLFAGDQYYPCGGWNDFRGGFSSIEDARDATRDKDFDWWHVIDIQTGQRVADE